MGGNQVISRHSEYTVLSKRPNPNIYMIKYSIFCSWTSLNAAVIKNFWQEKKWNCKLCKFIASWWLLEFNLLPSSEKILHLVQRKEGVRKPVPIDHWASNYALASLAILSQRPEPKEAKAAIGTGFSGFWHEVLRRRSRWNAAVSCR